MLTSQALHLGPLMLPWPLLIVMLSLMLTLWMTSALKSKLEVEPAAWQQFKDSLWNAIWISMIVSRLVFVCLNYPFYIEQPFEIFKIQDKGFHFAAAVITAMAWILWKNRKHLGFSALFIALLIALSSLGLWTLKQVQQQYQHFPQVQLSDLEQRPVSLQQFMGKPTIINLWASWCPPCHREMPVLDKAQQLYPDVQFVLVNQGEEAHTVSQYLTKNQLQLQHVLLDPQGLTAKATGMYGLPSTLFFDAKGQLMDSHMGEISHAVLSKKLESIR